MLAKATITIIVSSYRQNSGACAMDANRLILQIMLLLLYARNINRKGVIWIISRNVF